MPAVLIFSPEQSLRLAVLCGWTFFSWSTYWNYYSLPCFFRLLYQTIRSTTYWIKFDFSFSCSRRRPAVLTGSQLAAFLQLAFLMIIPPSGEKWRANGNRWNCFHNLFKYVVDSSPPPPLNFPQQLRRWLSSNEMFDLCLLSWGFEHFVKGSHALYLLSYPF